MIYKSSSLTLIIIATLVFLLAKDAAATSLEVTSLAQDSCWVFEQQKGLYKIASFNDKQASFITKSTMGQLKKRLITYAPDLLGPKILYQGHYLHCSSFGVALVSSFETSKGKFCSWGQLSKGRIEIISLGLTKGFGFCHGFVFGELLLTVTNEEKAMRVLRSFKWREALIEVVKISKGVIKVRTREKLKTRLSKIASALQSGTYDDWLKHVDYNFINHSYGEAYRLKSLSSF